MSSPASLAEPGTGPALDLLSVAQGWLDRLESAWRTRDVETLQGLFATDSHWRDHLALTGELQTVSGAAAIAHALAALPETGVGLRVAAGRTPPRTVNRAGLAVTEAIVAFDTARGAASGVLRLTDTAAGTPVAWVWHTSLDGLHVAPERVHADLTPARSFGGPNWAQQRSEQVRYDDREPAALVVGAGHAGLAAAAHLSRLGIDTLVIDRLPGVGDVWRNRYDALVLHNEAHVDHLPYLPFPPSTPRFMPRDKVADWLEAYARVLDLNVWTGTDLLDAGYDGATWSVSVMRGGTSRILRPRHLVLATGSNAAPALPAESGLTRFLGTVVHSSGYRSGAPYAGRRAVVLGTGSSAHDIAQDLHGYGAHVTMVQRGPTLVVSLAEAQKVYGMHAEGLPLADADLLSAATPYPVLVRSNQLLAAAARDADRDLLAGLASRGFRLDGGSPDATGFQLKLLRRGGGYYVNVGCSELIVAGEIGLVQHDQLDRVVPQGFRLRDGTLLAADLIVAGTGYQGLQDFTRRHLGDEVADLVGRVGGIDDAGELRNLGRRTAQPGLWFTGGGFPQARALGRLLALQVAMIEHGLLPATHPHCPAPVPPAAR